MPSILYAAGATGLTTRNYWRTAGATVLTSLDEDSRARINAANEGGGTNPTPLSILGYSSAVPIPDAEGAYTPQPAYELSVPSPDEEEDDGDSFWIGSSALIIDPLHPPVPATAPTPAAATATARQPRTNVQLQKLYTENDDVAAFTLAMDEKLELQNWAGATDHQVAAQILANIDPDLAAGLRADGARTMPKAAIYAMLTAMPRSEANPILARLSLMKETCTDSEPLAGFMSNLYARIISAHGHATVTDWIDAGDAEDVCQTIIGILAHAAPPRLKSVMTANIRTIVASVTDLATLRAARTQLIQYGASNASLTSTPDTKPQHANVFTTVVQPRQPAPSANTTTTTTAEAEMAALRAQIQALTDAVASRGSKPKWTGPDKFDPARHGKCKNCDGEDSIDGNPPGEHLRRDCPRR